MSKTALCAIFAGMAMLCAFGRERKVVVAVEWGDDSQSSLETVAFLKKNAVGYAANGHPVAFKPVRAPGRAAPHITVTDPNGAEVYSGTDKNAAAAGSQFDVVDLRTKRNVAQSHCITNFDVSCCTAADSLSDCQSGRSQNVCFFAVCIRDQCDESRTVGIVFDRDNFCIHIEFVAFEVNHTIRTFVATPAKTGSHTTEVITATGGFLPASQGLFGLLSGCQFRRIVKNCDESAALCKRLE